MISPSQTLSPEWQNENALRAYPLEDDAPAASVLPTWLIADLRVTCDARYDAVFISSAYVSDHLLSVGISGQQSYVDGGVTRWRPPVGLLTRTVVRDTFEPFRTYSLDRLSDTASGAVVFGEPPPDATPLKLTFGRTEAPIVAAALVRGRTPGVTRLIDPYHGTEATGIIDLSGNSEFRTAVDPEDPNTIVITLSDLYRDLTTSVCSSAPSFSTCGRTPIKTINGVAPDDAGVLTLLFR